MGKVSDNIALILAKLQEKEEWAIEDNCELLESYYILFDSS
jgi:hypothetical protein